MVTRILIRRRIVKSSTSPAAAAAAVDSINLRDRQSNVTEDESEMHSTSTLTSTDGNNNTPSKLSEEGKNYLAVPLKRKIIDLSDVPSQPPIPKRGRIKDGASKYTGVTFHKQSNKWLAQTMIEKKLCCIGYYEIEEEAAVDYARALFKYKGQGAIEKARKQNSFVDLAGVPPKSPIPKSAGRMKEGASKYAGIYFRKVTKKWSAQIRIDGTKRVIGYYEDEEEAAVDYARAIQVQQGARGTSTVSSRRFERCSAAITYSKKCRSH